MVVLFGYAVVLASLYFLYVGPLLVGGALFCFGGWLAGGLKLSLRSLGVVMLVGAIATGFHHGFSVAVIIVAIVGFLLANTRSRRGRRGSSAGDDGWGFDLELSDFTDFGGDGDGGGCGGGCGD